MEKTVRVAVMPGRINEFVVDSESTVAEVLSLAELDATDFDVKLDGEKTTDLSQPVANVNLIILAKRIKGNR